MKRQQQKVDPKLQAEHDAAWKALKELPLCKEEDDLFTKLSDLQEWKLDKETFQEHQARYNAGKPQELWRQIEHVRLQIYLTPESKKWYELYHKLHS